MSFTDSMPLRRSALPFMVDLIRELNETQMQALVTTPYKTDLYIIERVWNPAMRLDLMSHSHHTLR